MITFVRFPPHRGCILSAEHMPLPFSSFTSSEGHGQAIVRQPEADFTKYFYTPFLDSIDLTCLFRATAGNTTKDGRRRFDEVGIARIERMGSDLHLHLGYIHRCNTLTQRKDKVDQP